MNCFPSTRANYVKIYPQKPNRYLTKDTPALPQVINDKYSVHKSFDKNQQQMEDNENYEGQSNRNNNYMNDSYGERLYKGKAYSISVDNMRFERPTSYCFFKKIIIIH